MRLHRLLATLAVITAVAIAGPIDARQAAQSATLNVEGLEVFAYQGGFGGFETPLYTPPNTRYRAFLGLGNRYADCDYYQPYPLPSTDCAGKPAVNSFKTQACGPVDDEADGLFPLYNVTWTITLYGRKYVVQYNVPDPASGKVLVACDSFTKDQLTCNKNGYYYDDPLTAGYGKNLTAKVGNVCPKS